MKEISGAYHPPLRAQRLAGIAHLEDDGRLRLLIGETEQAWRIDELEISASLGTLPCSIRFPDGGQLETKDDRAITDWLLATGRDRRGGWLHRLERRWKWAAFSVGVVLVSIALFFWVGLPAASGWLAPRVPTAVRVETGRQVWVIVEKWIDDDTTVDSLRVARIKKGFERLVQARQLDPPPRLLIRGGGRIGPNAFTVPDGTIVLTDEMIAIAPDSSSILGILAHELGHLHHHHAMQAVIRASSFPILLVLLTGDLGSATSLVGTVPITLINNGYGRDQEREADQFALDLMREHGLDPRSMANLFATIKERYGDLPGWLSTHPAHEERISFFRRDEVEPGRDHRGD